MRTIENRIRRLEEAMEAVDERPQLIVIDFYKALPDREVPIIGLKGSGCDVSVELRPGETYKAMCDRFVDLWIATRHPPRCAPMAIAVYPPGTSWTSTTLRD